MTNTLTPALDATRAAIPAGQADSPWVTPAPETPAAAAPAVAPMAPPIPTPKDNNLNTYGAGLITPVNAQVSPIIPTSTLGQNPNTYFDLQGAIDKNVAKQNDLLNSFSTYLTPTAEELAAQTRYNDLQNQIDSTGLSAQAGISKIQDKAIPMEFIQGQADSVQRNANLALQTLSSQQQSALRNLQSLQATRQQKLDSAKFLFDANRNNFQDTLNAYKAMAPDNVFTKVDDATGNIIMVNKNPITGQITTSVNGNVKVTSPFYKFAGDPTIYRRDGKAYETVDRFLADGGDPTFRNVQEIKPETKLNEISPGNTLVDSQGNVVYQAPYKPAAGSSGPSGSGSGGKSVPYNSAVRKYIPSNISTKDFNNVYNALSQFADESNLNAMSTEDKYKAWGEAAADLQTLGYNPTDFDALLWEFFHPDKLAGYEKRLKEQKAPTKAPTTKSTKTDREI